MLIEKDFTLSGDVAAKSPVILNKDGTISAIDPEGLEFDDGFEWLSQTEQTYTSEKAVYDETNKLIWVIGYQSNGYRHIAVFKVEGRTVKEVATLHANMQVSSNISLAIDKESNLVIVAYADKSQGYTTTVRGFSFANNAIKQEFQVTKRFGSNDYSGGGEQLIWCETYDCMLLKTGSNPVRLYSFNSSTSGISVISGVSLSNYRTGSGGLIYFDQNTTKGLAGFSRSRITISEPNESSIRGFKINANKTITVGNVVNIFYVAGGTSVNTYPASPIYHKESSQWLVGSRHGSWNYTMDDSANLTRVGVMSNPTGNTFDSVYYEPTSNKFIKRVGSAFRTFNIDSSGNYQGYTDKPLTPNYGWLTPVVINSRNFYLMSSGNGLHSLYDVEGKTTNLSGSNFIGFSQDNDASDGESVPISLKFGATHKVEVKQNDLQPGVNYFLDYKGDLVDEDLGYGHAGLAITSNTLLVRSKLA